MNHSELFNKVFMTTLYTVISLMLIAAIPFMIIVIFRY